MELSEELELPPWEKFRLYGKFPWKLCLHFGLVALVTALVITTNLSYAAYSRSVWLTIANVLYPPSKIIYRGLSVLTVFVDTPSLLCRLCQISVGFVISVPILHLHPKSNNL